jgi:prepilin-type processing-associated H-X9-DG protein
MYQECPTCKGSGKTHQNIFNICHTCKGTKIISQITGLPPIQSKTTNNFENIPRKCSNMCFCDGSCNKIVNNNINYQKN